MHTLWEVLVRSGGQSHWRRHNTCAWKEKHSAETRSTSEFFATAQSCNEPSLERRRNKAHSVQAPSKPKKGLR